MVKESVFKIALRKRIVLDSIKVMLVVGTLLNIINQGSNVLSGLEINWYKLFLTYSVPYLVSTYASVKTILASELDA